MQIISINRKVESRLFLILIVVIIVNILVQAIWLRNSTVDIHVHDTYLIIDQSWFLILFITFSLAIYFISLGVYCLAQLGRWQKAVSSISFVLYFLLILIAGTYIYLYIDAFLIQKDDPKNTAGNLVNQWVRKELLQNLVFNASVVSIFLLIPLIRIVQMVRLFRRTALNLN